MHSFMNSHPLEYTPATFTFVQSRDDTGAMGSGVGALAYALNSGYRMYVRVRVLEEVRVRGGRR